VVVSISTGYYDETVHALDFLQSEEFFRRSGICHEPTKSPYDLLPAVFIYTLSLLFAGVIRHHPGGMIARVIEESESSGRLILVGG
jgi:hypothetical protein